LFIIGTDTGVGKTYVGAMIARSLVATGHRVGVYKPVETGCLREAGELVASDARTLWQAAGSPGELERVCPQKFAAPLAPHLAAEAEGRAIDRALLTRGLNYWAERSDVVLIEGAGGLLSPIDADNYVADLVAEFDFPLLLVTRNTLGAINQTLQTLVAAGAFRQGLPTAGVVLSTIDSRTDDLSRASNAVEIRRRALAPLLATVNYGQQAFSPEVDWFEIARLASSADD
jgi:dethiobiotin synthetase